MCDFKFLRREGDEEENVTLRERRERARAARKKRHVCVFTDSYKTTVVNKRNFNDSFPLLNFFVVTKKMW